LKQFFKIFIFQFLLTPQKTATRQSSTSPRWLSTVNMILRYWQCCHDFQYNSILYNGITDGETKGNEMPEIQKAEIISAEWHSPELHLGESISVE
jgi:hypothetical protein